MFFDVRVCQKSVNHHESRDVARTVDLYIKRVASLSLRLDSETSPISTLKTVVEANLQCR
jgi:hypothetical protein